MSKRKITYSLLLILFSISLILAGVILNRQESQLKIIFLDVGQGDAILIEKGSQQILIDGGPSGQKTMEKLGQYVPFWDRNIEILISTHPDQDHLSGLIDIMDKYSVSRVIGTGVASESQVYKKFKETMEKRNIHEDEGRMGMKIKIGETEMEILSPDGTQAKDNPKDTNSSSLVAKLTYGQDYFLFTGDIDSEKEKELISILKRFEEGSPNHLKVLKVSHHGSKYSTTQEFLDAFRPQAAVISVGKNNRYGHPSQEVLARLEENKIEIRRTDQEGDIVYECGSNNCVLRY